MRSVPEASQLSPPSLLWSFAAECHKFGLLRRKERSQKGGIFPTTKACTTQREKAADIYDCVEFSIQVGTSNGSIKTHEEAERAICIMHLCLWNDICVVRTVVISRFRSNCSHLTFSFEL
jgi:hypothetical protein